MKARPRPLLLASLAVLVALLALGLLYLQPRSPGRQVTVDGLQQLISSQQVADARLQDEDARVEIRTADDQRRWTTYPKDGSSAATLLAALADGGAHVTVDAQQGKAVVRLLVTVLVPLVVLANLFALLLVGGSGGSDGIGQLTRFGSIGNGSAAARLTGRLRKKGADGPRPVTFADVAGADEAVVELAEVVDYLRDPGRYAALKATPPKGVLLLGPPGTGKTLLARATAGEAGVPFFSVAGAEFVESLVGVGAARVRDLFARVREAAPAIVFIDEVDAAGRRRGDGGSSGGSDEREQTLNQLLVEMDGFDVSTGVVVVAATNRPDILDPALLRPGRFDRHVTVEEPDVAGREKILRLHAAGRPVDAAVDLADVARRTPGFTGADLAGVVNEAALLAVRSGSPTIGTAEVRLAVDRVRNGPQRRGRVLGDADRQRLAVREAARAVVLVATGTPPETVERVSLLRSAQRLPDAGGEPEVQTRTQLLTGLVRTVAPSAAEHVLLGERSTAGEHDVADATADAVELVARHGLGATGPVRLLGPDSAGFLGTATALAPLSPATQQALDADVRAHVEQALAEAGDLVLAHRTAVDALAAALLENEHLEGAALVRLLAPVATVATMTPVADRLPGPGTVRAARPPLRRPLATSA